MEPKVEMPPELIGTVAEYVADENPAVPQYVADENPALKSKTLTSCMLVSKTFAKEFRPFLFEVLLINDYERRPQASFHIRLCRDLLLQCPEYSHMVKKVVIGMSDTLIVEQGAFAIQALSDLLGCLTSVCSIVIGGATPFLGFDFEYLVGVMGSFDRAISRLCNLPTITTLSFDGCRKIRSTALIQTPHFQQVTLHDAIFCNSIHKFNFDPSYLADGFHLILRGLVHIPDDAAPLLSRVKKLSLYVETIFVEAYEKVVVFPLSSGYLRTLNVTIRGLEMLLYGMVLNLSEGKTLQHIHYTYTTSKYERLKPQEPNARILVKMICSLPPLSAVETISINLKGVIFAEDLRTDEVRNAWKELDSVLSNSRRFPALKRVDLDVAYEVSKTKAADELLALKAVASSMLGSLSEKVLTVSVYALEVEEGRANERANS